MKVLFYTRFEGNTGGDEALLNIFQFYMLKNPPSGSEIHLCLSYDEASAARAQRVKKSWEDFLSDKKLTGTVWLFLTTESSLEKSIPGIRNKYIEYKKIDNNTVKTLDSSVQWYINETSKGTYYLQRPKSSRVELSKKDEHSLMLKEKPCYFSREKSATPTEYPLFVLEESGDTTELVYYKDLTDSSPEIFPLENIPNKFNPILNEAKKKKNGVLKLSEPNFKTITTYIAFIPKEVLITAQELNLIADHLTLPEEVLQEQAEWNDFLNLTRSLDAFIFAGWAHLQSPVTARHLKTQFELPAHCKILLSCVPGMSINGFGFVTGLKNFTNYQNIHVLQTGVTGNGGFPMLPSLTPEKILNAKTREEWINHIGDQFSSHIDSTGKERSDKLIVIYCSKDGPGEKGGAFLQKILLTVGNAEDWPVLLVGANPQSKQYLEWKFQCEARSFPMYHCGRTQSSAVLMRGLRDAQFAMATGSYSILEARYLGIEHCEYLGPPHMRILDTMLSVINSENIKQAFIEGERAGGELSKYLSSDYNSNFFTHESAWSYTNGSDFIRFIEEAQMKKLPNEDIESSSLEDNHEIAPTNITYRTV